MRNSFFPIPGPGALVTVRVRVPGPHAVFLSGLGRWASEQAVSQLRFNFVLKAAIVLSAKVDVDCRFWLFFFLAVLHTVVSP